MDEVTKELRAAYDAVAYESHPHRRTHPDRLAVVAAFRGIPAANVERCRVLEIGCASGGNLIPMGEQLPQSSFLGIDLSENQVRDGLDFLTKLDLPNVELRCQDLMEFSEREGKFDYIIVHGVYSWVPRAVQERLLDICRNHLEPTGMAYISYNTYPGWRTKEIGREAMVFRARAAKDASERVALGRQMAKFMASHASDDQHSKVIAASLQKALEGESDDYVLHEYMEPINEPQYFWRFIEDADSHGLGYVGEADANPDHWLRISATAREAICAMTANELEREQLLDFLIGRTFRASVLCPAAAVSNAKLSAGSRLSDLYISGNPPEVPAGTDGRGKKVFQFGDGVYKANLSDSGSLALIRHICGAWPAALSYQELLPVLANHEAGKLKPTLSESLDDLLNSFYKLGFIEITPRSLKMIAAKAGSHPRMTLRARLQSQQARRITSLRHLPVKLDPAVRQLVPLLDGTRDRSALVAELVRLGKESDASLWPKTPEQVGERLEVILKILAKLSLLVN